MTVDKRTILVDEAQRELTAHGTNGFPLTVNHDDLWMFEQQMVPVHWHQDLEICLPTEGTILYRIYQDNYELHPGQALLINSDVPHSSCSPSKTRAVYSSIIVRPDFLYGDFGSDIERNCFRPFLSNGAVPCMLLSGDHPAGQTILGQLTAIDHLFYAKPPCFELKIKALLCDIFSEILPMQQPVTCGYAPGRKINLERLELMLSYLHTHFDAPLSLSELSGQLHLSREVCCRLFRTMTGRTISSYLEEYRIHKSLPLLQSGKYSISQVADMTGFSNSSRFANAFRKQIGCNPSDYHALAQRNLL